MTMRGGFLDVLYDTKSLYDVVITLGLYSVERSCIAWKKEIVFGWFQLQAYEQGIQRGWIKVVKVVIHIA